MSRTLHTDHMLLGLRADSKKDLLHALAAHAATHTGVHAQSIFDDVWTREKLGTTGVGHGIAIPNARVAGVTDVLIVFAVLAHPVDYDALDERPVDVVCMILAPEDAGADHLRALAWISGLLCDPALCARVRAAADPAALHRLLSASMEG